MKILILGFSSLARPTFEVSLLLLGQGLGSQSARAFSSASISLLLILNAIVLKMRKIGRLKEAGL